MSMLLGGAAQVKSKVALILAFFVFGVGFQPIYAQVSGWGNICNTGGVPYSGFSPDLTLYGNYPDNPYTSLDISGGSGCSWNFLPLSENLYITPQVSLTNTPQVRYSFYYQSSVAQTVTVTLLATDIGDNEQNFVINLDLDATGSNWNEAVYIWDGDSGNAKKAASLAINNPDGNQDFSMDNISIAEYLPANPTPTATVVGPNLCPGNVIFDFQTSDYGATIFDVFESGGTYTHDSEGINILTASPAGGLDVRTLGGSYGSVFTGDKIHFRGSIYTTAVTYQVYLVFGGSEVVNIFSDGVIGPVHDPPFGPGYEYTVPAEHDGKTITASGVFIARNHPTQAYGCSALYLVREFTDTYTYVDAG